VHSAVLLSYVVCLSVTLVDCDDIHWDSRKVISSINILPFLRILTSCKNSKGNFESNIVMKSFYKYMSHRHQGLLKCFAEFCYGNVRRRHHFSFRCSKRWPDEFPPSSLSMTICDAFHVSSGHMWAILKLLCLTLRRPLFSYGYSCKAFCTRPDYVVLYNFWHSGTLTLMAERVPECQKLQMTT